jgi:hypothetical protein
MAASESVIDGVLSRAPKDWERVLQGYGDEGIAATRELARHGLVETKLVDAASGRGNPYRAEMWRRAATPSGPTR